MSGQVAVLFAAPRSVYFELAPFLHLDVYDELRDARTWRGGCPVVAHPPCRLWSRLRHLSKAGEVERALGPWAVERVRESGGVLEHPEASVLWRELALPEPGRFDAHGFTFAVDQHWWGHRARKRTLLYVVGLAPRDLPLIPFSLGRAAVSVEFMSGRERSATPPAFARWLVDLARRCHV